MATGKKQPQLVLASMFIYIWVFPKNRGTPKWIVYNFKTFLKWMIWGYPYFWKHPYDCKDLCINFLANPTGLVGCVFFCWFLTPRPGLCKSLLVCHAKDERNLFPEELWTVGFRRLGVSEDSRINFFLFEDPKNLWILEKFSWNVFFESPI